MEEGVNKIVNCTIKEAGLGPGMIITFACSSLTQEAGIELLWVHGQPELYKKSPFKTKQSKHRQESGLEYLHKKKRQKTKIHRLLAVGSGLVPGAFLALKNRAWLPHPALMQGEKLCSASNRCDMFCSDPWETCPFLNRDGGGEDRGGDRGGDREAEGSSKGGGKDEEETVIGM